jgi:Ni/Fe-hydrogenase subunit HybB-like protein
MEGFVFPNEETVTWTVMIVLYPYITGLVAGAFIVSSLYHVFGATRIKAVARFSLASAFVFLLFATLPLLMHLGQPQRAFNIMITPNFTSAMAGFGYIYLSYTIVVALEIWFVMREDFVARAREGKGLVSLFCRLIMFNQLEVNDETRRVDHKITRFLAALGIPMACLLHGYVGFLFGSLKANPWWSTPLMFIIFLFSAIVSGISVLIFHYTVVSAINGWKVDRDCVRALGKYLWAFMMVAVTLELMEVLSIAYKQTEEWEILNELITGKLFYSYVVFQFLIFSLVPFVLLAINAIFKISDRVSHAIVFVSATMLLAQVLLMRWNVVIGGQLVSKSMRGFTSYWPGLFEKEGLATAAVIFTAPFLLLWVFNKIVPLFPGVEKARA